MGAALLRQFKAMTAAIRRAWAARNMRYWGRKRDIVGDSG
jgi:hypothetical protein